MLMCLQFSVSIFEISLYARSLKSYWHIKSKAFPYFYLNSSMPISCLIFKASLYARSLESYWHIHYKIVGFSVYLFKNFHANLLTIFRLIFKASMYARSLQCMLGTDWQNQLVILTYIQTILFKVHFSLWWWYLVHFSRWWRVKVHLITWWRIVDTFDIPSFNLEIMVGGDTNLRMISYSNYTEI